MVGECVPAGLWRAAGSHGASSLWWRWDSGSIPALRGRGTCLIAMASFSVSGLLRMAEFFVQPGNRRSQLGRITWHLKSRRFIATFTNGSRGLYLEIEDMFLVLGLGVLANFIGRFLGREIYGIPLSFLLLWVVPILAIPCSVAVQVWKAARVPARSADLADQATYLLRPGAGPRTDQGVPQVMPTTMSEHKKALRKPPLCELLPVRDYLDGVAGADGWQLRRGLRTRRAQFATITTTR